MYESKLDDLFLLSEATLDKECMLDLAKWINRFPNLTTLEGIPIKNIKDFIYLIIYSPPPLFGFSTRFSLPLSLHRFSSARWSIHIQSLEESVLDQVNGKLQSETMCLPCFRCWESYASCERDQRVYGAGAGYLQSSKARKACSSCRKKERMSKA